MSEYLLFNGFILQQIHYIYHIATAVLLSLLRKKENLYKKEEKRRKKKKKEEKRKRVKCKVGVQSVFLDSYSNIK